jgi:hypothetical protein
MIPDRFENWRCGVIARSQRRLADIQRLLIYKTSPSLFDRLDFEDDRVFLDPLLFAWFTDSTRSEPPTALLNPSGRPESLGIPGTAIEVLTDRHPLLDRFFVDDEGNPQEIEVAETTRVHYRHLTRAFALLHRYCPEFREEVAFVTRYIMLYRGKLPNSFATLSAHGAVFFNITEDHDEVFFLDDIAHQCGHVLFNAFTLEKERFLARDPMTPLTALGGPPGETRTLYSAFHGLFTYTCIGPVLSTCLERQAFDDRQAHEALGRLGFILRKFRIDLALLNQRSVFTPRGWRCYRIFAAVYRDLQMRYGPLVDPLDYANQPYVFNYRRFAERNPRPVRFFRADIIQDIRLLPQELG